MNLSANVQRYLAIAILILVAWLSFTCCLSVVNARLELHSMIVGLQDQLLQMRTRMVNAEALRVQLKKLKERPEIKEAAINSVSEKAAQAILQNYLRKVADTSKIQLVSLSQRITPRDYETKSIHTQIRIRGREAAIFQILKTLEEGAPHISIDELSIMAKTKEASFDPDLEAAFTINANWTNGGN